MVRTPVDSFSSSSITRVMVTDWAAMDVVVLFMIIGFVPPKGLLLYENLCELLMERVYLGFVTEVVDRYVMRACETYCGGCSAYI